jgi:hypothetical protein
MTAPGELPPDPPASAAIAAAEAEIAQTRRNLDAAIAALRREFALPIAAVMATALLVDEAGGEGAQLHDFVRRNAFPLGLIGLGAAWLAVENRGSLGTLGGSWAREFLERARALGKSAAEAALTAALEEIGRPAGKPPESGADPAPAEATPAALVSSEPDRE